MSAFVCQNKTIDKIAGFFELIKDDTSWYWIQCQLQEYGVVVSLPDQLGKKLFELNCFSVDERYGPDQWKQFTGGEDYHYTRPRIMTVTRPIIFETLAALSCWLYQSCEGDAAKSPLYKAMQHLQGALSYHLVSRMPEMEKARKNTWA